MKRKLTILILVTILLLSSTFAVMAGGDKVRGEKGIGSVNQVQIMNPPPFQPWSKYQEHKPLQTNQIKSESFQRLNPLKIPASLHSGGDLFL